MNTEPEMAQQLRAWVKKRFGVSITHSTAAAAIKFICHFKPETTKP